MAIARNRDSAAPWKFIAVVVLVVLACGAAVYFRQNLSSPEPSWHGRMASDWLQQVETGNRATALHAFREMGPSADPVLLWAFQGKESWFATQLRRIRQEFPPSMSSRLPLRPEPATLRSAAGVVVLNTASKSIVPKLIAMFGNVDSKTRRQVLSALFSFSVDAPPDAQLVPLFVVACQDPDVEVREWAASCLGELGPAAAGALPAIRNLCGDTSVPIQIHAARALWHISHETNLAVPVLSGVLHQATESNTRYWVASDLAAMGITDNVVVETLIGSLTNSNLFISTSACDSLAGLGTSARTAIPALRIARGTSNVLLSAHATRALAQIEPSSNVEIR